MKRKRDATAHYKEQVNALKRFKARHKRFPKRTEELGQWCANQKYYYRKGKLSESQIKLLMPTGLLQTGEYNFCLRVDLVGQFYHSYSRVPFRDERLRGYPVGQWWYRILTQLVDCSISNDCMQYVEKRYPELYSLAQDWKLKTFLSWVHVLEQYQRETGNIEPKNREIYQGHWLGSWCCKQRRLARIGALSTKQLSILREFHIISDEEPTS